jgi:NADH-quinone oxidoreductase subunit N
VLIPSPTDLTSIAPEIVLAVAAGVLLLVEAFLPGLRRLLAPITIAASLIAAWARFHFPLPGVVWGGLLSIDRVAAFVDLYILVAVLLTAWMSGAFLRRNDVDRGEFYSLLLLAAIGAMVMAASVDALTLFLGLELLSIPLYVLNGFLRGHAISIEAGLKYFVVGAFASAFVVYGFALMYGMAGSTRLEAMGQTVVDAGGLSPLMAIGLAMVVGGLGFKLALFPFHAWAPDVYQGGPTPVTAFLSVVPKGAALVALLRVVDGLDLLHLSPHWVTAAGIIAVASMTLGNIVAIVQRDIKRMLAYSGIAHMGYAMVAIIVAGIDGGAAVLVYLAAYTLMNVGAFAVVALLSEREDEPHLISELAGQGWTRPIAAFALTLCLVSLAGVPPLIGFTGKFVVFRAAVNHGFVWLAVLGVLNSLISAFYYLRVVYVMYMQPLPRRAPVFPSERSVAAVAVVAALGVVLLGVFPMPILEAAHRAILDLVR